MRDTSSINWVKRIESGPYGPKSSPHTHIQTRKPLLIGGLTEAPTIHIQPNEGGSVVVNDSAQVTADNDDDEDGMPLLSWYLQKSTDSLSSSKRIRTANK